MTPTSPTTEATLPASLNPRSASCLVPFGIGLVLVIAAYVGIKSIESHTGPWAIQAARTGIAQSGLPSRDRAVLTAEVGRLEEAFEGGRIEAQSVVQGVDEILREPLIALLSLDDTRVRRVPDSGLDAEQKAAAARTLEQYLSYARSGLVDRASVYKVAGPLVEVGTDGAPAVLDDGALKDLVRRAELAIAGVEPLALEGAKLEEVSRSTLLADLSSRIGAVVTRD